MDGFFDPVGSLGPFGLLLGVVLQWLLNSGAMWIVMNHMWSVEGGAPFSRCMLCTAYLTLWSVIVGAAVIFLPIPLIGILGLIAWYFGAKAIVEGVFELLEGALSILILYWVTSVVIGVILGAIMGS